MTNVSHLLAIGGELRPAQDGAVLPVVDPYRGETFATIADATARDVDDAVAVAAAAFHGGWNRTPGVRRAELLHRLADEFERRADELGEWESRDNGKLLTETRGQARFAARNYRFFAGYADKLYGRTIPLDTPDALDYTLRQPLGVVALVTAWNSPMQLLANKLAPALAAGNTVVIKPSEHASVTTAMLPELIAAAGFPPGVVNVVTGGVRTGAAIAAHPGLGRISFTGSVPTGQAIARAAAENLVPVTLELGGKSANIVLDDADLERAVQGALAGIFSAGGQTCIAGSRLLVQRGVYDHVVEHVAARAALIRLGDPFDAATHMGPLANQPQWDRVSAMIAVASDSGAEMVAGGEVGDDPALGKGLFIRPTVFAGVDNHSRLAREEIFGPVLAVIPFDDDDEAIALANDSEFGLASGVWTTSLRRAHRVADRIVAGTVWVNTYRASAAQAPFGGVGKSGHGRERGEEALDEYLRTKNVLVDLGGAFSDPFADLGEEAG